MLEEWGLEIDSAWAILRGMMVLLEDARLKASPRDSNRPLAFVDTGVH